MGQASLAATAFQSTAPCFPSWDLLHTLAWMLSGKEVLLGHSLVSPLSVPSAVAQPAPGEGAIRPIYSRSNARGGAALEVPGLGLG